MKTNNVQEHSADKVKCCGCAACYNICPKHTINMEADNEGFVYPIVNLELCIDCGLCKKVCPMLIREVNM